jgi:hypothetical protein
LISSEGLNFHFDKTKERTAEIRPFPATAINDDSDSDHLAAVLTDNVDCLLDPAAAGDHVLRHQETFTLSDLKSAPENKSTPTFLREDMPFA